MRYTLVTDGPSDVVLKPVVDWALRRWSAADWSGAWADLRWLPRPPKGLGERVRVAVDLYPCAIVFVHRDAERVPLADRRGEIERALDGLDHPPHVCVVPVRMQEAWLLFDETALRLAAGRPSGRAPLDLPPPERVEQAADPQAASVPSAANGERVPWPQGPQVPGRPACTSAGAAPPRLRPTPPPPGVPGVRAEPRGGTRPPGRAGQHRLTPVRPPPATGSSTPPCSPPRPG